MKILHFADAHINAADHGNWSLRDAETGRSLRTTDFLNALNKVAAGAIREKVDCVLFAGDAYDTENPDNWYRDRFQTVIGRIADEGIPVVMIPGNHDRNKIDMHNSALSAFASMQRKNVFVPHEPTLLTPNDLGVNLYIVAVPWKILQNIRDGKTMMNADGRKETAAEIDALISEAQQKMGAAKAPVVLLTHGEVEGAVYNGRRSVNGLEGEMSFTMDTVADKRLTYTALGHLHKFQNLNKDLQPPVVYSGSIERIDISEAKDDKGYVLVNIDEAALTAVPEFRSVQPRKMFDIKAAPKGDEDINTVIEKALPSPKRLKDAVVKVTVTCPLSRKDSVDRENLAGRLSECFQIIGACPNMDYVHEQRVRLYDNKIMKTKSDEEILSDYFASKGKQEEDINRLVLLHKALSA